MNIIIDMDGVILDTERLFLDCCIPAAEELGLPGIEEVVCECTGLTDEETRRRLQERYGEDAPLEEFGRLVFSYFEKRCEETGIPVKEGVIELLDHLKDRGVKIAIGSSTHSDIIETELRDAGIYDHFDVIVGGEMVSNSKPAPDVFLLAAEKLQANIKDCIIIEDSFNGVRAASAAGATVFMVPDLLQPTEEIRALADRVFVSLTEVKEYINTFD